MLRNNFIHNQPIAIFPFLIKDHLDLLDPRDLAARWVLKDLRGYPVGPARWALPALLVHPPAVVSAEKLDRQEQLDRPVPTASLALLGNAVRTACLDRQDNPVLPARGENAALTAPLAPLEMTDALDQREIVAMLVHLVLVVSVASLGRLDHEESPVSKAEPIVLYCIQVLTMLYCIAYDCELCYFILIVQCAILH